MPIVSGTSPVSGMPSQLDRPTRPDTFELVSDFAPSGDQPGAIAQLVEGVRTNRRTQVLLGATGTGKTFTMANVIAATNKPTLVISHNKTLAAQLYEELRAFFPRNSVNYFVSYYDYYQPEAYIPGRDIYIEKDASRNDDLDQLRLAATSNLLSRRDTVVIASVSCIFGLGSPSAYSQKVLTITRGSGIARRDFFLALNGMQYQRADIDFKRGSYRARGDAVEVWPAYERFAVRVELFGDTIDRIDLVNPLTGEVLTEAHQFFLFPAVHYVMPEEQLQAAVDGIRTELDSRVAVLRAEGKVLEAQRLLSRTKYDLEMIQENGFCNGIENYSRYMDGRAPGERPFTLLDYFDYAPPEPTLADGAGPADASDGIARDGIGRDVAEDARRYGIARRNAGDWLLIIDESHVTIPQIQAMFNGDRARKQVLVDHGFRLPSALDNRPIRFEEFEAMIPRAIFVSATPGPYELNTTGGEIAEQVIRPTGLLDPIVEIRPARDQVQDMVEACRERVARGDRVLVTAMTKRLCEDLTNYLADQGLEVRYLHSEIDTLDRVVLLQELRQGVFDVLVGVNLLREGLDLPEVSLVCILDADKEGYLRSATSLIQTMGRAARNADSKVILYADQMTEAMRRAIEETERRRAKQVAYNQEHGITPRTVYKAIRTGIESELRARRKARNDVADREAEVDAAALLKELEADMVEAAQSLEFEKAATLRDRATALKRLLQEHIDQHGGEGAVERAIADGEGDAGMPPLMIRASEVEKLTTTGKKGGRRGSTGAKKPGMPGVRTAGTRKGRKGGRGG